MISLLIIPQKPINREIKNLLKIVPSPLEGLSAELEEEG